MLSDVKFLFILLVALLGGKFKTVNCSNCSIGVTGFGHEITMAGLDSLNYSFQRLQLRSKEYFESLRAEIEDIRVTIRQTEALALRQTRSLANLESKVDTELDLLAMNVTQLLTTVNKMYKVQQLIPTIEMINDVLLNLIPNQPNQTNSGTLLLRSSLVQSTELPLTCSDVTRRVSGLNRLHPQPGFQEPFEAYCDQDYEDGGWTVIQNRFNGHVHFYRGWTEYENGFGNLRGEFWLGLRKIHELTYAKPHQLHVVLEDFEGNIAVAKYSHFKVAGAGEKYALTSLGSYSGDAGDSLGGAVNLKFTTMDSDNDSHPPGNCAVDYQGGWWYGACHESNLNGLYMKGKVEVFAKMMCWKAFKGYHYGLKRSRMMIKATSLE